jgi:hypothetical protein
MACIARNRARLAFPADALLTPGTFYEVKALTQRRELLTPPQELLAEISVPRPEIEKSFDPLVSRLRHSGAPSCAKVCDRAKTRKNVLSSLKGAYYTNL